MSLFYDLSLPFLFPQQVHWNQTGMRTGQEKMSKILKTKQYELESRKRIKCGCLNFLG